MPDGGYRPAYNWQFSVELSHFVITGVDVVNTGSDKAQMEPMVKQVVKRTHQLPKNWLIDGGFVKLTAIETLDVRGVTVFGPIPEPKDKSRGRYAPLSTDSDIIAQWRQRRGAEEGKATYKQRSLVELPNAHARSRYGVQQVRVRGRRKVRCVALWVGHHPQPVDMDPPSVAGCFVIKRTATGNEGLAPGHNRLHIIESGKG